MWRLSTKNSLLTGISFVLILLVLPKLSSAKTLTFEDQTWEVPANTGETQVRLPLRNDFDLVELAKASIIGTVATDTAVLPDNQTIVEINKIAETINQKPQEAKLIIEGNLAKEFNPGNNGQSLDVYALLKLLNSSQPSISLPVLVSRPGKVLGATNDLGIRELVAVGESDFTGSPKNRIENIRVGTSKFNGLVIAQGEEFSFNKYLGDVDAEHGFLPELVIKATGTVPEFGGGLCQVSSTTFRAAMNAGLPITARRNHSYAVQYYAPQGTDATIYPGVQDLKFLNNLASAMVIRTKIEGTKLFFEFYGTKDDRTVTFEGPVQYDRETSGALKATWTRHVVQNGETATQVFNSNYRSPALFHKVEQASTPNPDAVPPPTQESQTN